MAPKQIKQLFKVLHRQLREQEFAIYGKSLCHTHIVVSKKLYSRKAKHKEMYI